MVNIKANRAIPSSLSTLRTLCRPSIRRFINQINEDRASLRSIARKIGVSHVLIRLIYKNPDRKLSRKVLIKILRRTTKRQLVKPRIFAPMLGSGSRHGI